MTRDRSIYEIPEDALWDSVNMVPRNGQFVTRPGPQQYAPHDLLARPTGAIWSPVLAAAAFQADAFQADAFQTTALPAVLIASTQEGVFYLDEHNDWVNIMPDAGDVFQADAFQSDMVQGVSRQKLGPHWVGRFIQIQYGTPQQLYTVFVNGADRAVVWNMGQPQASQVTFDNPPLWSDAIVAADRFVGITPPYDVSWGEDASSPAGPFSLPALNRKSLSETPDPVVAIRRAGLLAFTVYKARSVWTAVAQGGSSATAFRFQWRGDYEGPASASAVVSINGMDIRMTRTGRVAFWNGQQNLWPFDGAWRAVKDGTTLLPALDRQYAHRIFGVYHEDENEVWFHYPQVGDNGDLYGVFILTLPDQMAPDMKIGGFPGRLRIPVSAGCDRAATDDLTHLFRSTPGQNIAMLVGTSDQDLNFPIPCDWMTGMTPAPGGESYRMDGHETLVERRAGYGTLQVRVMSSFHLDSPDGTLGAVRTLDLNTTPLPKDEQGDTVRGRFFGLRYSAATPSRVRWMGARLSARMNERTPSPMRG